VRAVPRVLVGLWVLIGFGVGASIRVSAEESVVMRVSVAEIDNSARAHLERADAFLANGQRAEAVDTVRRVMDAGPDSLVAPAAEGPDSRLGFTRYLTVRRYCQQWLARLYEAAPDALADYRSQVDAMAEQWLRQAEADRDERGLQRVVDEFFVSSSGDQSMLRLGSIALERGWPRRARECWEQINPLLRFSPDEDAALSRFEGDSLWWLFREVDLGANWGRLEPLLGSSGSRASGAAYPDSQISLPELRARLAVVSILEGDAARARWEIDLLKRLHSSATGTIAGKSGRYVDLLEAMLRDVRPSATSCGDAEWKTFAGTPSRNGIARRPVDPAGHPLWQVELPRWAAPRDPDADDEPRVGESGDGLLGYFPVVQGAMVAIPTGISPEDLEILDLHTGRALVPRGIDTDVLGPVKASLKKAVGVTRFTATIDGNRIYARVGSPITGSKAADMVRAETRGKLVALDLAAERRLAAEIRLDGPEWNGAWAFEGSPLVEGDRVFVALRRRDALRAECHVACFDARRGRLVWRRFVCAAETLTELRPHEITHALLSLDQGTVFCNSNLGAVAALRANSGEIQWLTTYPRRAISDDSPRWTGCLVPRDLNPCVVYRDFVFAAPSDSDALFALDAISGRVLWQTQPEQASDVVHLLGVGQGRLLASGDCLYWLDIYTGRTAGQFPRSAIGAPGRARPNPRGWGRGTLAGDYVYWPTRDSIFVLEQRTEPTPFGWETTLVREIPLGPRGATGGNLVIVDGMLLIAAADRLYAFNETGRLEHAGGERRTGRSETQPSLSADNR
jgi:outer membrane protein assembly factor BamB